MTHTAIVSGSPIALLRADLDAAGPTARALRSYLATRLDLLDEPGSKILGELGSFGPRPEAAAISRIFRSETGQAPEDSFRHLEVEPFAWSAVHQWHEALLASGEKAILKIVRPELNADAASGSTALQRVRSVIERCFGTDVGRVLADFERWFETVIDLKGEVETVARLDEESSRLEGVKVARVVEDLSGERCLTLRIPDEARAIVGAATAQPASAADRERQGRRLCRAWLKLALSGGPVLLEAFDGNVLVGDDGTVILSGGSASYPTYGNENVLRDYLAATAVRDHRRIHELLLELVDDESGDSARLRHRLRHSAPFRDGRWDQSQDDLVGAVLVHWRHLHETGYRPRPDLLDFYRGLYHLSNTVELLSPNGRTVHASFQELRLRDLFSSLAGLSAGGDLGEALRRQAAFVTELPAKIDRLLTLAGREPANRRKSASSLPTRKRSWLVLGAILVGTISLAALTPRLRELSELAEPGIALLTLLLGTMALLVASRP